MPPSRIPLGQMDARQQATFFAQAGIQADVPGKSFTPTSWDGFSVNPTGAISYLDFGELVILYSEDAHLGTSDDTVMFFEGLPEALRPVRPFTIASSIISIGGFSVAGMATIEDSGRVSFQASNTTTVAGRVIYASDFPALGSKGLPVGWLILYAK